MKVSKTKDIVAGLGEIGKPILQLLKKQGIVVGYDINPKLMDGNFNRYSSLPIRFLHICIPYTGKFSDNVIALFNTFQPQGIVIHSTIEPYTTKKLQDKLAVPVMYSATRGVHKRMLRDLKRYAKFFAIEKTAPRKKWAITSYSNSMKNCGVKAKQMSSPITLELAKIVCDTSYYGWLITYAQLSNVIAMRNNVNYDEMWLFADEIHKFLKNRPKMFPGFIGGHCVVPNLDLIKDEKLYLIKQINDDYARILEKNN